MIFVIGSIGDLGDGESEEKQMPVKKKGIQNLETHTVGHEGEEIIDSTDTKDFYVVQGPAVNNFGVFQGLFYMRRFSKKNTDLEYAFIADDVFEAVRFEDMGEAYAAMGACVWMMVNPKFQWDSDMMGKVKIIKVTIERVSKEVVFFGGAPQGGSRMYEAAVQSVADVYNTPKEKIKSMSDKAKALGSEEIGFEETEETFTESHEKEETFTESHESHENDPNDLEYGIAKGSSQ